MRKIVLLTLFLFTIFHPVQRCFGTNNYHGLDSVSIPIYFRFNDTSVILDYRTNVQSLKTIGKLLSSKSLDSIARITVCGSSSIDGSEYYNADLAKRRATSLYGHLLWKYPALKHIPVSVNVLKESDVLMKAVTSHPQMPNYDRVLDILMSGESNVSKIEDIKLLSDDTNNYFNNNILPYCRVAVSYMVYFKTDTLTQAPIQQTQVDIASAVEDITTVPERAAPCPDQPSTQGLTDNDFVKKPIVAIKTNLLFDLASAVNLELEVPIGKRWSIAGEFIFPWWLWSDKQYCLQLLSGNLEGRYWIGNRDKMRSGAERQVMTGWFAGFYAGGGYYDFEWKKRGYQGEFFIAAGISAGYVHAIGRNLRMEYSVGVGYLQTNYRYYEARKSVDQQWHLYRQNNGRYTWFGPTRAKVSLVWMLNRKVTPEKMGR